MRELEERAILSTWDSASHSWEESGTNRGHKKGSAGLAGFAFRLRRARESYHNA